MARALFVLFRLRFIRKGYFLFMFFFQNVFLKLIEMFWLAEPSTKSIWVMHFSVSLQIFVHGFWRK